jgi:hypothetical protein
MIILAKFAPIENEYSSMESPFSSPTGGDV